MKRSTSRILTTHAGRLNGPPELTEVTRAIQRGDSSDIEAAMPLIRRSMAASMSLESPRWIARVTSVSSGGPFNLPA